MTRTIRPDEPLAVAVVEAIQGGDVDALRRLLRAHPDLATVRIQDDQDNAGTKSCTLLHVATDWPGHFPNGPATVAVLTAAGADVDARFAGPTPRRPCIGPRAATTSTCSMRSSTPVPTWRQRAP